MSDRLSAPEIGTVGTVLGPGFLPPAAERVSESEHDDFGDGDALDKQEGAIGAEDP